MTIVYLGYIPPIASMWADCVPSTEAAESLGMSVDEVDAYYFESDMELVREQELSLN